MQVFLNLNPEKLFHMEHFFSGFIFFLDNTIPCAGLSCVIRDV